MATTNTILNISVIPSAQPASYSDRVVSTQAPIFMGVYENALITEKPLRYKDDDQYLIRPIQTQYFRKYKLQFITNEYYLENIKYSSKVIINQEDKDSQRGFISEVTRELKAPDVYLVVIEYYDLNSEEIAEHLKSDKLLSTDNYVMTFGSFEIKTRITPLSIFPEPEQATYSNDDVNILTKSVLRKQDTYTFYLNREDTVSLQSVAHYTLPSVSAQTAQEIVKPTITELAGNDIFKIEIPFTYEIFKYYD